MSNYAPYSDREEYCLVEGQSGIFYPGVRVENISFPLTISAQQGAMCSCLANGDQPVSIFLDEPDTVLIKYWEKEFDIKRRKSLPESPSLFDPLLPLETDINTTLKELTKNCVIPHSDFPVTALLETQDGYISGVNIEVSVWSNGLCAERTAIHRAITAGYGDKLGRLHIYAPKGDFISPCGACRQVMAEFIPEKQVVLHHGNETSSSHFVKDLLPFGFTGSTLKKKK